MEPEDNSYAFGNLLKSPYLDVQIPIDDTNRYIYMVGARPVRGRLEHCFFEIGMAFLIGGAIGGFRGFLQGKEIARGYPPKLYRTMLFNQIVKKSTLGNTLGILALIFSGCGICFEEVRGKDDALNNIGAATLTGAIYGCSRGVKKSMIGGITGLVLSSLLVAWPNRHMLAFDTKKYFPTTSNYEPLSRIDDDQIDISSK